MDVLSISGKKKLFGRIVLPSAKNAVLPMLAAAIACEEEIILKNCTALADTNAMLEILSYLGGQTEFSGANIIVNCKDVQPRGIGEKFTSKIRSSIFMLGPLLARFRRAEICYPGGCEIGLRPIDLHIEGLKKLGVKIDERNGKIVCDGSEMKPGDVYLDFPSVGATENIIMASIFLPGRTTLHNAAMEPEVRDLGQMINSIGGRVYGAGSDTVYIDGVKRLFGGEYSPVSDRIYAGTLLSAIAICGGRAVIENYNEQDMKAVEEKLRQCGMTLFRKKKGIEAECSGALHAVRKTETHPFPGFPTDMQPQFTSALCYARGTSIVVENLFESRFRYTRQLIKAGADITVKGSVAVIKGKGGLECADMQAEDLRGGAALIIAALGASGISKISGIEHVDRGYYKIEKELEKLGADVVRTRIKDNNSNKI